MKARLTSLVTLVLFGPAAAFAAGPAKIQLKCRSNPPTTSFLVRTEGDTVTMTMIQSNGTQYMPIFEGIATPSDIPMIQDEARYLSQLPAMATFTWPLANCKDNGNSLFECWRGGATHLGNLDLDSYLFYTHRLSEQVFDTQVDWYRVTLSLEKAQHYHDIVMDFSNESCDFN